MMRLTERESDKYRFLRALRREETSEVPFFETELSPGMVERIIGVPRAPRSYLLEPSDYVRLLECCGIDMMYVCVPHHPGRIEFIGNDGRRHYRNGRFKRLEDLEEYTPQDPDAVRARVESLLEAVHVTRIGWCYAFDGPSSVISQIGYQDYYMGLYDNPEFIHEFLKRQEESTNSIMDTVLEYDPDAAFVGANLCMKTGPAMRIEMAEEFVLSGMDRQVMRLRQAGVPVILHSDGNNRALMDRWVDMGIDAFHPVEACPGFDIFDAKAGWGDDIALLGSIDVMLLAEGTVEAVRRETLRHLEGLSSGGGYICGSSHDIDDNCRIEHVVEMVDTICNYAC